MRSRLQKTTPDDAPSSENKKNARGNKKNKKKTKKTRQQKEQPTAVDQHRRQQRHVVLRLDRLPLLAQVPQQLVVRLVEKVPRQGGQPGVDVTGAGRVLAALQARSKLPRGHEQVDVVASHKVLRQAHDGLLQARLAVVVGRVLADVTGELGHLDVAAEVALEAGKEDLSLARLQAVDGRGDGALEVGAREEDELLFFRLFVLFCFVLFCFVDWNLLGKRGWRFGFVFGFGVVGERRNGKKGRRQSKTLNGVPAFPTLCTKSRYEIAPADWSR